MGNNGGKPWFEEGPIGDLMEERYYRENNAKKREYESGKSASIFFVVLWWIFEKFMIFTSFIDIERGEEADVITFDSGLISLYIWAVFLQVCFLVGYIYDSHKLNKWKSDRTR